MVVFHEVVVGNRCDAALQAQGLPPSRTTEPAGAPEATRYSSCISEILGPGKGLAESTSQGVVFLGICPTGNTCVWREM